MNKLNEGLGLVVGVGVRQDAGDSKRANVEDCEQQMKKEKCKGKKGTVDRHATWRMVTS
jgi:hypothetical protein